jgi:hypothetical protein
MGVVLHSGQLYPVEMILCVVKERGKTWEEVERPLSQNRHGGLCLEVVSVDDDDYTRCIRGPVFISLKQWSTW